MLTGKQKRFLRAKAHSKRPVFQIGKEGITRTQIEGILDHLEKNELMKVSVLKNCVYEISDLIEVIEDFDINVVQSIGRVLVLYKESKENKTIRLP